MLGAGSSSGEGKETPGGTLDHELGRNLQLPRNLKRAPTTNAPVSGLARPAAGIRSPRRGWRRMADLGHTTDGVSCQKSTSLHPLHGVRPMSSWKPSHRSCDGGSLANTEHPGGLFPNAKQLREKYCQPTGPARPQLTGVN